MPKLGDISGSFKSLEGDIKGEKHEKNIGAHLDEVKFYKGNQ